jgi:hypothetical protein
MTEDKIERCFWCGKPKSEELTQETEETLHNSVITNYIPCDRCKKSFGDGIHVIGVTKTPIVKDMFPISKSEKETLYPTGSMFVANDSFIKDMLSENEDKELLEDVLKERVLMIPNDLCEEIINSARSQEAENVGEYIENNIDTLEKEEVK